MSGHIVNLEQSVHQRVQELLPWYAMNKLAGAEQELVQEHVRHCAACRDDLVCEHQLLLTAESEWSSPVDMECALARLHAQLDSARPATGFRSERHLWHRLRRWSPSWTRWTLAAQSAAIVVLAMLLVLPQQNAGPYRTYRTLGAAQQTTGNLIVMFDPSLPERELRQILHASDARITDGPTATAAYVLQVPADQLDPTLRRLRAEKHITLAEPLTAGGGQ